MNRVRKTPPFSPSSSPPIKPGRSGYLQGMLCALRQLVRNASGWPGYRYAISARSRGGRFPLDAGEIVPRLRTCTQATQRRYTVADRAEHATEISGLPGFDRWRRSRRERWPDYDACRQRLFDKISNLKSYGKYNHSRPFRQAESIPPTTDTSMNPFAIVYP